MKVDFAFLCDDVVATDEHTSAAGIGREAFLTGSVPMTAAHFSLVVYLRASPAEIGHGGQLRVNLLDADGRDLIPSKATQFLVEEPSAPGESSRLRFVTEFNKVTFPSFGEYAVAVTADGWELASLRLAIKRTPTPS